MENNKTEPDDIVTVYRLIRVYFVQFYFLTTIVKKSMIINNKVPSWFQKGIELIEKYEYRYKAEYDIHVYPGIYPGIMLKDKSLARVFYIATFLCFSPNLLWKYMNAKYFYIFNYQLCFFKMEQRLLPVSHPLLKTGVRC